MNSEFLASLLEHYQWQLSLYTAIGIGIVSVIARQLVLLVPTFKAVHQLNQDACSRRWKRPCISPGRIAGKQKGRSLAGRPFRFDRSKIT